MSLASYLINEEKAIPFKSIGRNCKISPFARFYNPENIEIGDNVRIDDFCIISAGNGGIKIGNHIHIAVFVSMIGAGRIELKDYSQVAAKCSILSSSDDFSGEFLVGPQVPEVTRNVRHLPVTLEKYAVLGCNSVVFPGVTIGENTATGAFTLVRSDLQADSLYVGNPARKIKERPRFDWEAEYLNQIDWHR